MHQFLGDTANIDTGPSQTPGSPGRARLHEVTDCDLLAQLGCLLASGEAPGPSTDDDNVVIKVVELGLNQWEEFALRVKLEGVVTASDVFPIDEGVGDGPLTCFLS